MPPVEDDLRRVSPQAVERLLSELGWTQVPTSYKSVHMWRLPDIQPRPPRILVPTDLALDDYAVRLDDALDTLTRFHAGDREHWYERLLGQAHDVIRFELQVTDSPPGTVGVEAGIALHEGVRNALNAAAKSQAHRQPYFGPRGWQDAATTLNALHFGQPAAGSFVIRVLAMPSSAPEDGALFAYSQQRADLRRFAEHLVISLQAARSRGVAQTTTLDDPADDDAPVTDGSEDEGHEHFETLVEFGVSADLCSALFRASNSGRLGLTVAVEWSDDIPPDPSVPTRIEFTPEVLDDLGQVGEELKESGVWPDAVVSGTVENLRRVEGESGVVTIVALTGTAPKGKKVRIRLADDRYEVAIEAHRSDAVVLARGQLTRVGNRFWLNSPQEFRLDNAANAQKPTLL